MLRPVKINFGCLDDLDDKIKKTEAIEVEGGSIDMSRNKKRWFGCGFKTASALWECYGGSSVCLQSLRHAKSFPLFAIDIAMPKTLPGYV